MARLVSDWLTLRWIWREWTETVHPQGRIIVLPSSQPHPAPYSVCAEYSPRLAAIIGLNNNKIRWRLHIYANWVVLFTKCSSRMRRSSRVCAKGESWVTQIANRLAVFEQAQQFSLSFSHQPIGTTFSQTELSRLFLGRRPACRPASCLSCLHVGGVLPAQARRLAHHKFVVG